ncbi:MAG: hypothetical protein RLO48_15800 [Bauldia litoralis]
MTKPIAIAFATTLAAAALTTGAGHAASFDCAKATTPTEHAICDNPQLSSLDDQTSGKYYTMISNGSLTPAQISQVKTAQAQFLKKRDACGANYDCLIDAYTAQIMYLKAEAGEGM